MEITYSYLREKKAAEKVYGGWLRGERAVWATDWLNPRFLARKIRRLMKRCLGRR